MTVLWSYFWPCFAAGLLVGGPIGTIAFRRRSRRNIALAIGVCVSIGLAAFWHGPLGAADRLSNQIEQNARQILAQNDAPGGMSARVHREPLTRRLILSGPGDSFQQAEAARLLSETPGASDATWGQSGGVPLILEGAVAALVGFLFGLLLAYLVELRRRHNSQWTW